MRGCCGRESARTYIVDRDLDGGNNSSSVISGSGFQEQREVRQRPVAAHARVMILWPFYN
ncbi:uncharacterized protein LOC128258533 [Drosophila gunungcola]|uniref:uncharacterized protein LOC128258533 n=1 Tax=Drosophila gunungcola TaxID=103775 RepID=UPI0022E576D4|nr:uncharacterized protein LOC128258533 [Drosophila gunungcola]